MVVLDFLFDESLSPFAVNHTFFSSIGGINNAQNEVHNEKAALP
jgi:hypothetical protein